MQILPWLSQLMVVTAHLVHHPQELLAAILLLPESDEIASSNPQHLVPILATRVDLNIYAAMPPSHVHLVLLPVLYLTLQGHYTIITISNVHQPHPICKGSRRIWILLSWPMAKKVRKGKSFLFYKQYFNLAHFLCWVILI